MARKRLAENVAAHEFTREDWLAELAARYPNERKQPGDLTASDIATANGMSDSRARAIMRAEVEAGRAEFVRVRARYGLVMVIRRK